jgi:hypothetical protein
LRTRWAAQSKSTKLQDSLEVGEQHLDALAVAPRLLECFRSGERPCDIARVFMDAARDFALCGSVY